MKEFTVDAFFPEAVSHVANQSTKIRASKLDLAAKKGLSIIMKRTGIRKKQIRTVRLTIAFVREIPMEWFVEVRRGDGETWAWVELKELGTFKTEKFAIRAAEFWASTQSSSPLTNAKRREVL